MNMGADESLSDMSAYEQALDSILALSELMLTLAQESAWMSVIEVEDERRVLMGRLSELAQQAGKNDEQRMELIRKRLQAILKLNETIIDRGHLACQALSREIRKITGGRQVRQAYLSNM